MKKKLYIQLLEEHVDDLTTAMKIDTVLTSRKIAYMGNLENQLVSVSDWNKAQDELISKITDTAMDYQDDINDQQANFAELHKEYKEKLVLAIERTTRECNENVRLQSKIAELEKDRTRLAKRNENLKEDLETARKRIKELGASK